MLWGRGFAGSRAPVAGHPPFGELRIALRDISTSASMSQRLNSLNADLVSLFAGYISLFSPLGNLLSTAADFKYLEILRLVVRAA
jgi:hypothetical protein